LGGNPFSLEETINALVDAGMLKKKGAAWEISGTIGNAAYASTISAVIAERIDRLWDTAKRILQEASVIGRRFSPTVLKKIAADPEPVGYSLHLLKSLGFIVDSSDPGDDRCQFKHALIQDVAYNSLLKGHRRDLHEKIAQVLVCQGPECIEACCETLAYHFSHGHSLNQAFDYLKRSGRRGLKKYAVIESHKYYENAYRLLSDSEGWADDVSRLTVELLLEWFFVFNLRGRYEDVLSLMKQHESAAMNNVDLDLKGMYLVSLGWAYQRRENLETSRHCMLKALSIGERINNSKVIAYACACLIWTCTDMGRLDEALVFAARAEEASRLFESEDPSWSFEMDQDLVRFVLTGTAVAQWFKGDCHQCRQLGDRLLAYGEKAGDVNSISEGHLAHGMASFAAGDYRGVIEKCILAIERSVNPLYAFNARFLMAYAHLSLGEVIPAEKSLDEIITFCKVSGYEYIGTSADALSSVVAVAKGNIGPGVKAINRHVRQCVARGKYYNAQTFHYMLGSIYLRIALREGDLGLSKLLKNIPFLVAHLPRAARHAEYHFEAAIRIAGQINAIGVKGQAVLDLGRLHQAKKRNHLALPLIKESIALFEQLGAAGHLKRAQAALNRVSER